MRSSSAHKPRGLVRPSVLTIAKIQTGRYRIALDRIDDESRMRPIQIACDVLVQPAVISHFTENIDRIIAEANVSGDPPDGRALSEAGKGLLDVILPRGNPSAHAIREELAALRLGLPLLIATDDPGVPWELLKEEGGDQYVGLKFDIGRRLVLAIAPPAGRRVNSTTPSALIVANPTGDLPEAEVEAQSVQQFLEGHGVRCSILQGADATFSTFLDQLREGHSLIHFAGHIRYDDVAREYAFVLHDGKAFAASAVRAHLRGRPVVFLNGCESGIVVKGLTEAFLAAGARAVVGAHCPIPDGGAQAFAQSFYEVALSGKSGIGGALRHARMKVSGKSGLGATWASFILYGDPTLRVSLWDDKAACIPRDLSRASQKANSVGTTVGIGAVGPLRKRECAPAAWQELLHAVQFAARPSGTVVTSLDLFQGFLVDSGGLAALSFQKLGFSATQVRVSKEALTPVVEGGIARCTENVSKILLMAQATASASGRLVDSAELLNAFVAHGGGKMGTSLRSRGIVLASLTSRLFREGGELDYSRFSSEGACALEIAEEFADQTNSDILRRAHLLYGLLRVPECALGDAIRKQGLDPEILSELLYAALPRGNTTTAHCRPLRITSMSAGLLDVLCLAEQLAGGDLEDEVVGAKHLAGAWVRNGGGVGGSFLVRNGVRVTRLFE